MAQRWIVFAFDETTGIEKTGDASNITANIHIDGGTANAVDDTNPTELGTSSYYYFDLTAVETDGEVLTIAPVSTTADIQVVGSPATVRTFPNIVCGITTTGGTATSITTTLDDAPWSYTTNDAFNGRVLIFDEDTTTAALRNQAGKIIDYVGSTGTITVATNSFTISVPTANTFKIY